MYKQTIAEIKELLQKNNINEKWLNACRMDERKGVQKLMIAYDKKVAKEQEQIALFNDKCLFDEEYRTDNHLLAGVDEAGRGPLAGPVVAAAVILPKHFKLYGLTDSKQISKKKREQFYRYIKQEAMSYHIQIIDAKVIDERNILEATKMAMIGALNGLDPLPNIALIDAVPLNLSNIQTQSIIKGDDKSLAIAAASILAKVKRDRIMEEIHQTYPMYGFNHHQGYGTKAHILAIEQHGPCPYHRRTFTPVSDICK